MLDIGLELGAAHSASEDTKLRTKAKCLQTLFQVGGSIANATRPASHSGFACEC